MSVIRFFGKKKAPSLKSFMAIFALAIFAFMTGPPVQAATAEQYTVSATIGSTSKAGLKILKATDNAQSITSIREVKGEVTSLPQTGVVEQVRETATAQAKTSQIALKTVVVTDRATKPEITALTASGANMTIAKKQDALMLRNTYLLASAAESTGVVLVEKAMNMNKRGYTSREVAIVSIMPMTSQAVAKTSMKKTSETLVKVHAATQNAGLKSEVSAIGVGKTLASQIFAVADYSGMGRS